MKKFKSLFLVAAALMLGFSSCNNDNDGPDGPVKASVISEGASVRFAVSTPDGQPVSRLVGPTQTEVPVYLERGTLIFSNGTIILRAVAADPGLLGGANQMVTDLPGGVTHVHFLGNVDLTATDVLDRTLASLANQPLALVTEHPRVVQAQMRTVGAGNNVVNVWGTSTVFSVISPGTAVANPVYGVTVILDATVARVELFNVTGDEEIAGFSVRGIFIDSYYERGFLGGGGTNFRVIGTGLDGTAPLFVGRNVAGSAYDRMAFNNTVTVDPVPGHLTGVVYDWGTWDAVSTPNANITIDVAGVPTVVQRTLMRATPGGGANMAWGYNLYAGTNQTLDVTGVRSGTRTPRIAIRMQNVTVREAVTSTFTWVDDNAVSHDVVSTHGVHVVPHPHSRTQNPAWVAPTQAEMHAQWLLGAATFDAFMMANAAQRWLPNDTPLFVSIRGFQGVSRTTGFQPRHVYQLGSYAAPGAGSNSHWTFGPGDLDYIPFRRDIDIEVGITVQNWVVVGVNPEFN